uniref:Uncharacterized protein n=1 Tax=viral metagenome TaxID=1070528 RepID=A0A6C0BDF0_9ZZZZ
MIFDLSPEERKKYIEENENPYGYNPLYLEIYNKERLHRNLKGFDHLIDITDYCIDSRDTTPDTEILYAPKIEVPYELNYKSIFNSLLGLFENYIYNIFICGGMALSYYFSSKCDINIASKDIDLFIASTEETEINMDSVKEILSMIANKANNEYDNLYISNIRESSGAVSFDMEIEGRTNKIQIIKRLYSSPSEIIHGFDIDCTCILTTLDGLKIYTTERGYYSIVNQVNTINFERMSPSYPYRKFKYYMRGFSIKMPFLEYFRDNFVTDFRLVEKLEGCLVLYYKLLNFRECDKSDPSDYENYRPKNVENSLDNVEFITTNPNEQVNNTFNKTVIEDIKNWYVTNDLPSYKDPGYIRRGDIKRIYPSKDIISFKESYYPFRLINVENDDGYVLNFLKIFKSNHVVCVGEYPFSLLTNTKTTYSGPTFAFFGVKNLMDSVNEILQKFVEYKKSFFEDECEHFLTLPNGLNNLEDICYKSNFVKDPFVFHYRFVHKNGKPDSYTAFNLYIKNFSMVSEILDTQEKNIYRVILHQDSSYYTDSLGEHSIKTRFHLIGNGNVNSKIHGISKLVSNIKKEIIDPIFTKHINDSFKIFGNPRIMTKLYGPNTLTFYKDFGENSNRRILILGEFHSNKYLKYEDKDPTTFDLHMWLYRLSKTAPECLDIYLEIGRKTRLMVKNFKQTKISEYTEPISSVASTFDGCIPGAEGKCFSSSVRYHLIDLRMISNDLRAPFIKLYQHMVYRNLDIKKNIKLMRDYLNKTTKVNGKRIYNWYMALQYLGGLDKLNLEINFGAENRTSNIFNDKAKNIAKNTIREGKKIFENAYKIVTLETAYTLESEKFNEYRIEYIKKISKTSKKIINFDINRFTELLLECYNEMNNIFDAFVNINMDVYFLLRYLQTFTKIERGPDRCQDESFNISKNTIVHAGGNHSMIYSKFIKKWFQIKPTINIIQDYSVQSIVFDEPFDFFE